MGQAVRLAERTTAGIRLPFANSETATADIVVAADDANSRVRPYISQTTPTYSGISVVEGNVRNARTATPEIHKLTGQGNSVS